MPIRLNLLAEDQAAEDARRRDPFKRSIWVAGFVVCLVLLWGLSLFLKIAWAKAEVAGSTTKWETIEKSVKQVETNQRLINEIGGKLKALTQFTTNRFLWANCLETLQQTFSTSALFNDFAVMRRFPLWYHTNSQANTNFEH